MSSLKTSYMPKVLGAITLFAVLAVALALPPATAEAGPPSRITTYYATAACISVVGKKYEYCDGDVLSWGQVTSYKTVQYVPCDCECMP